MMTAPKREDDAPEKMLKYYEVVCPRCRASPGFPCVRGMVGDKPIIDPFSIHIARVILHEAYALGTVDHFGLGRNGQMYQPGKE